MCLKGVLNENTSAVGCRILRRAHADPYKQNRFWRTCTGAEFWMLHRCRTLSWQEVVTISVRGGCSDYRGVGQSESAPVFQSCWSAPRRNKSCRVSNSNNVTTVPLCESPCFDRFKMSFEVNRTAFHIRCPSLVRHPRDRSRKRVWWWLVAKIARVQFYYHSCRIEAALRSAPVFYSHFQYGEAALR